MDNATAVLLVALLVCPISMGVMMWMMNKHAKEDSGMNMKSPAERKQRLPQKDEQN